MMTGNGDSAFVVINGGQGEPADQCPARKVIEQFVKCGDSLQMWNQVWSFKFEWCLKETQQK